MTNDNLLQTFALLDAQKHWTLKCLNRNGQRRRYEATVWGNGRRATASAGSPLDAARAALRKVYGDKFRVVS